MLENHWVTYDQVSEAAESILLTNQRPTALKIREYLGHGSNTTIQKYLNQWKQNRPKITQEPPDAVNLAVKQVWEKLNTESKTEIEKIKTEFEQKLSQANEQMKLLQEERAHFAQAWSDSKQAYQALNQEKEQLVERLKEVEQAFSLSKTTEALLSQSIQELKDTHASSIEIMQEAHRKEIDNLNQQWLLYTDQSKNTIEQLIATHESQRHEWLLERENLKISHSCLLTQYEALEKNLAEKNALLAQQETRIELSQREYITLEKNKVALEVELASQKQILQEVLVSKEATKKLWLEENQRWDIQFGHNKRIKELLITLISSSAHISQEES